MKQIESPRADDSAIEQEIKTKGLTAPRVTPAELKANIVGEFYCRPSDYDIGCGFIVGKFDAEKIKRHTLCILTLRNGFTVVGVNEGPVSADNFDAELGRKLARQKALEQVWPLMGYALRDKLALFPDGIEAARRPRMHPYVGSKAIRATPMTRQKYNDLRGWTLPVDENGDDEGMLVEYLDGGTANVTGFEGYVSWSPMDVFKRAYQPI